MTPTEADLTAGPDVPEKEKARIDSWAGEDAVEQAIWRWAQDLLTSRSSDLSVA